MAFWRAVPWMAAAGLGACVGQAVGWQDLLLCCCGVVGVIASLL